MIEGEWLAHESAEPLLVEPLPALTPRRLRLFAVACAEQLLQEHPLRPEALDVLRYAEDVADEPRFVRELRDRASEYEETMQARITGKWTAPVAIMNQVLAPFPIEAALATCRTLALARGGQLRPEATTDRRLRTLGSQVEGEALPRVLDGAARSGSLLREIVGNPFRPPRFDPSWRTSDVMLLARGIYDDRAFDRMPILADALQDAGCDSEDILAHCRDPHATHVRGCWVVDLVLGEE
jgi:hypothetical protein